MLDYRVHVDTAILPEMTHILKFGTPKRNTLYIVECR
jgi:hypothetical protein